MSDVRLAWGRELAPSDAQRSQIAAIVCDAFAPKFATARVSGQQIMGVLSASCDFAAALYALDGDQVVGVLGITTANERFFQFHWRALRDHLSPVHALAGMLFVALARACPPGELWIEPLAIALARRGQGIGTRLLERIITEAHTMGLDLVALDVVDTNVGARRLYERVGFCLVRTRRSGLFTRRAGFTATHHMHLRLDDGEAT